MAEYTKPNSYAREVRNTIIKSSLTGVAATVLAVTIFSPAGLGGMIGTSVASGLGLDKVAPADDAYANLPPYPSPLTQNDLSQIRGELARTTASLEITRAATEAKIDHLRSIAVSNALTSFTAPPERVAIVAPEPVASPTAQAPQVQASSAGGGADLTVPYKDPNRELAALLFAHENF